MAFFSNVISFLFELILFANSCYASCKCFSFQKKKKRIIHPTLYISLNQTPEHEDRISRESRVCLTKFESSCQLITFSKNESSPALGVIILLRMHIVKGWGNFQKSYEKDNCLMKLSDKKNNVYQNLTIKRTIKWFEQNNLVKNWLKSSRSITNSNESVIVLQFVVKIHSFIRKSLNNVSRVHKILTKNCEGLSSPHFHH